MGCASSLSWLAKPAVTGGGPRFRKIGRFPVYTRADLDMWIEGRTTPPRRSTSAKSAPSPGRS